MIRRSRAAAGSANSAASAEPVAADEYLWEQRQRDHLAHAALLEPAQRVAERRVAVAHPER